MYLLFSFAFRCLLVCRLFHSFFGFRRLCGFFPGFGCLPGILRALIIHSLLIGELFRIIHYYLYAPVYDSHCERHDYDGENYVIDIMQEIPDMPHFIFPSECKLLQFCAVRSYNDYMLNTHRLQSNFWCFVLRYAPRCDKIATLRVVRTIK